MEFARLHCTTPYGCRMKSLGGPSKQPWFDIKVLYVRLSACLSTEAPDSLQLTYPPRQIHTELEVNGARIPPSKKAYFTLRKDREDADSAEATYVSTNHIRVSSDLPFEIHDRVELLVYGTLHVAEHQSDEEEHASNEKRWSIDCSCGISSPSSPFLKGRGNSFAVNPCLEVYMAGRSQGCPIVLTETIQLISRKKSMRQCSLDVIMEDEEISPDYIVAVQVGDDEKPNTEFESQSMAWGMPGSLYCFNRDGVLSFCEGEKGEVSWFNAGVRVGVGIGLGICLGAGIGVGLLMRTYNATTRSFRRHRFL